ncbi:hypothetical protein [Peribacillus simplex]|uniref:hypothetical protein n=1 Tax=Peribacillus simplex TaxID=1478 RepID=UPI003D2953A6
MKWTLPANLLFRTQCSHFNNNYRQSLFRFAIYFCCVVSPSFTAGFTDAVLSTTVFDFAQNLNKIIYAQKNPAFLLDLQRPFT